jgi:hypothetical protein
MRRPYSRLAAACALAVVTAVLASGSAFAGGNPNAPGQEKKAAEQAQPQQQPQTQAPAQSSQAQTQQPVQQAPTSPSTASTGHVPPGQAKKQASSSTQTASAQHGSSKASVQASTSSQAGVKPSSTTTHWTHCMTGSSSSGATCTPSDNGHTPSAGSDVSKRYGNGQTAAQIAVSRGGVNVQLTGPGNSQPHKVSVCGKPSNPSGGVDVHAVKSYSNLNCQPTQKQSVSVTATCGSTIVVTTTTAGIAHGHGEGLVHNKHMQVTTSTSVVPNGQVCSQQQAEQSSQQQVQQSSQQQVQQSTQQQVQQSSSQQSTSSSSSNTSSNTSQSTAQAPVKQASAPTKSTGGVLGAMKTLKPQRAAAAHHGVLGTVTHVAGSTLPFTGFPVWLAVLIALGLIGLGLGLRRRAAVSRL